MGEKKGEGLAGADRLWELLGRAMWYETLSTRTRHSDVGELRRERMKLCQCGLVNPPRCRGAPTRTEETLLGAFNVAIHIDQGELVSAYHHPTRYIVISIEIESRTSI